METQEIPERKPPNEKILSFTLEENNRDNE
jgi:hypothetical protein